MLSRRSAARSNARMRSSARRSMRSGMSNAIPLLDQTSREMLEDAPTMPLKAFSNSPHLLGQALDNQSVPQSSPNEQVEPEHEEDAWLNDVKPAGRAPTRDAPTMTTSSQPGASIKPEPRLQSVMLHLSERIWREFYQKPDVVPARTPAKIAFVRKRFLDVLRGEPGLAGQVHNLAEAKQVLNKVLDEVLGYGPLESLLGDERVSEIMVVGPRLVCVERDGEVQETSSIFEDERHMLRIIENMLRQVGQHIERPIADLRLPDGSFVNIVMPPSAVNGPTITIRKCSKKLLTMADLVQNAMLTQQMADFLSACVRAHLNIIICGGMSSGRTTLLNALCACIPPEERIVTIEDVPELQLSQKHVVSLISQVTSSASSGRVTMRDLVINALHMRLQRVVIGECRGEETIELLQAMHSGHDGFLITMYAKNLRDCLARLEMMSSPEELTLSMSAVRAQIASSLDMLVHVARLHDGSCKIMNIAGVQEVEHNVIKLQSIFYYRDRATNEENGDEHGLFMPGGFCPTFLPKLEAHGISLPVEMFVPQSNP